MTKIQLYKIQDWLFNEAEGKFDIDLAESGIQYHCLNSLEIAENYPLNYSLDHGDEELRSIIASMYGVKNDQIIVTHGSQEALYLFYRSFLTKGDHVITFSPGWQQSWEVPLHIGAEVSTVPLRAENNYNLLIEDIEKSINDKTRLIILNSPHNPTGSAIDGATLTALIDLCKKHKIRLLNDEEYLTDYQKSIVNLWDDSCAVSSLSKVYGFPGLRIGWFVGPKDTVKDLVNYRRYTTVSNSYLCEKLACQVLKDKNKHIERYNKLSKNGLTELRNWIKKYPSLKLIDPQGTPFCYISFPSSINTDQFAKDLLAQQQVLVMPAEVFEDKNAIRLSFGRPVHILQMGFKRMDQVLEKLL